MHYFYIGSNEIGGGMLDDSTWEQPLVIYTRAWLDRKASNLSLSNRVIRVRMSKCIHAGKRMVQSIRVN